MWKKGDCPQLRTQKYEITALVARDDYERYDGCWPPAFVGCVTWCCTVARGFERKDRRLASVHPGRSLMPAARRHAPKSLTIVCAKRK